MPTKLRVILIDPERESPLQGGAAIAHLCRLVQRNLLAIKWPADFKHLYKRQKIEFLAKYLPKGVQCAIFREGRHTRANRSIYIRTLGGAPRRRPVEVRDVPGG